MCETCYFVSASGADWVRFVTILKKCKSTKLVLASFSFICIEEVVMKYLDPDWMIKDLNEVEIPRYRFLDYVQSVYADLNQSILFPDWEEIYLRYKNLSQFKSDLLDSAGLVRGDLIGANMQSHQLLRDESGVPGFSGIDVVRERLDFSLPVLKKVCQYSQSVRNEIRDSLNLDVLGLYVPNRNEGLLLLQVSSSPIVWVWQYQCSVQKNPVYPYSAIRTNLLGDYKLSLSCSLDFVKRESLKKVGMAGAVVSTWVVTSEVSLPVFSTLKPLAVQLLATELGMV